MSFILFSIWEPETTSKFVYTMSPKISRTIFWPLLFYCMIRSAIFSARCRYLGFDGTCVFRSCLTNSLCSLSKTKKRTQYFCSLLNSSKDWFVTCFMMLPVFDFDWREDFLKVKSVFSANEIIGNQTFIDHSVNGSGWTFEICGQLLNCQKMIG